MSINIGTKSEQIFEEKTPQAVFKRKDILCFRQCDRSVCSGFCSSCCFGRSAMEHRWTITSTRLIPHSAGHAFRRIPNQLIRSTYWTWPLNNGLMVRFNRLSPWGQDWDIFRLVLLAINLVALSDDYRAEKHSTDENSFPAHQWGW